MCPGLCVCVCLLCWGGGGGGEVRGELIVKMPTRTQMSFRRVEICCSFLVLFIVWFGFSTTMLVLVFCCSLLLFVAFRCFSLPVLALSSFSWLLISATLVQNRRK